MRPWRREGAAVGAAAAEVAGVAVKGTGAGVAAKVKGGHRGPPLLCVAGDPRPAYNSPMSPTPTDHYGPADLVATIRDALDAARADGSPLALEDVAALDQLHIGGLDATRDLARAAALRPGMRVLDVGGGLGGPARLLARDWDVTIEVLDLTPELCEAGALLTDALGLADHVTFRQGDALALPYPRASFDAVWTQHSGMHILDKAALYAEIHRVLRPGGTFALHEVVVGAVSPIHTPVPWARDAAHSILWSAERLRDAIIGAGFVERVWQDESQTALAWLAAQRAAPTATRLNLRLLFDADAGAMVGAVARNLREERIHIVQAVFTRP